MLDNDVPVTPIADFLGVAGIVMRRWMYGYKGQIFNPGGRADRRELLIQRIELLCKIIEAAYWRDRLKAPWLDNFKRVETDVLASM